MNGFADDLLMAATLPLPLYITSVLGENKQPSFELLLSLEPFYFTFSLLWTVCLN